MTLGPDQRFALWVQGCPFTCKGCMTQDAIPFEGGQRQPITELAEEILSVEDIEGVTISGGEPFAQAEPLAKLIETILQSKDLGVIIYSGYRLSQLQKKAKQEPEVGRLLALCDLLIDGLYIEQKNDGAAFKGSANQQVCFLTERYKPYADDYLSKSRKIEFHVTDNSRMLVGVPNSTMLEVWQSLSGK